jgi:hypothetical protein
MRPASMPLSAHIAQLVFLAMAVGFAANALMVDDENTQNAQVSGMICIACAIMVIAVAQTFRR